MSEKDNEILDPESDNLSLDESEDQVIDKKERKKREKEKKKQERKKKPIILRIIGLLIKLILLLILALVIGIVVIYMRVKPVYNDAQKQVYEILTEMDEGSFKRESNTLVFDSNDTLLSKLGFENYKYITIDKVSKYVQEGYIDVEDKHFLTHFGVDIPRTVKVTLMYIRGKINGDENISQGGSTITQQVVKNNLLSQEQTLERKFLEILLAMQIEKESNKSQIMEYYVNSCYYGNGCYGIEGASKYYFGVSADNLSLAQAAILVGTSNSPNVFNPVADYELSMSKKGMVLGEMLEEGDITQEEYDHALNERPEIVQKTDKSDPDNYMVSFAIHDAALKLLEYDGFEFKYTFDSEEEYQEYRKEYSREYNAADSRIRSGGFEIHTSFDQKIQKKLQKSVDDSLSGESSTQDDGQYSLQGAGVIIDNESGMIIAAVGGRGTDGSFNRAFQAMRQPGSTIKPLLDYGPAIDRGVITPGSVLRDTSITIAGYTPKNVDGSFRGNVTMREAIARSINTIAVQLFDQTGSVTALSYLDALKFSSLTFGDAYNTAIALGGFTAGVTVEDMARGYATIENGGSMRDNTCIRSISGEIYGTIYSHNPEDETTVYSEDTAFMLTDMLQGVFYEEYGTAYSAMREEQIYAGKTGTTDGNKDAWFAGFSKHYTVVTWVGCDTPRKVEGLIGGSYPLTIWSSIMDKLHKDKEKVDFTAPDSVKLTNKSGQTKDVNYTKDMYESRPDGWDYISTLTKEKLAESEARREETYNYDEALEALKEFEDFQISSTEDAFALEEKYYNVMELISQINSSDKREELQERAEYKYYLLSGDVLNNWQERMRAFEQQEIDEKNLENARKAEESSVEALNDIKDVRIDTIEAYIEYLDGVSVYTSTINDVISDAEDALEACQYYTEYDSLSDNLSKAAKKARSQKTEAELKKEKEEADKAAEEALRRLREAEQEETKILDNIGDIEYIIEN